MREEYLMGQDGDWSVTKLWVYVVQYFIPIAAITLLVWWLSQSIDANWYDPFQQASLMTVLAQWAVMLVLFIFGNKWIARKMSGTRRDQ